MTPRATNTSCTSNQPRRPSPSPCSIISMSVSLLVVLYILITQRSLPSTNPIPPWPFIPLPTPGPLHTRRTAWWHSLSSPPSDVSPRVSCRSLGPLSIPPVLLDPIPIDREPNVCSFVNRILSPGVPAERHSPPNPFRPMQPSCVGPLHAYSKHDIGIV
jgi:hypothetical protein